MLVLYSSEVRNVAFMLFILGKQGAVNTKNLLWALLVAFCLACFTFLFLWIRTSFLFSLAQVKIGMP